MADEKRIEVKVPGGKIVAFVYGDAKPDDYTGIHLYYETEDGARGYELCGAEYDHYEMEPGQLRVSVFYNRSHEVHETYDFDFNPEK